MKVIDIVRDYLKQHGHDGLCHVESECGCGLDDLAPCGDINGDCEAADQDEKGALYYPSQALIEGNRKESAR
jgi:hypothetical protein